MNNIHIRVLVIRDFKSWDYQRQVEREREGELGRKIIVKHQGEGETLREVVSARARVARLPIKTVLILKRIADYKLY